MKRFCLILLSVLMCALLIVSCEPQKPVEEVADYFAKGTSGKTYTELKGTIDETITFTPKDYAFDLNGETLNITNIILPESEKEYTVTIKNGTINGNGTNAFQLSSNSRLILDSVKVNYNGQAVAFLCQGSNPVWLEVKESTLTNNGTYGIGTNASKGTDYVYVTLDDSSVTTTSSNQDNTGILFNVPGELKITNSTIRGERQGAIVRGGEATISNSEIISSGIKTNYYGKNDYVDGPWSTGNEVPLAALVIGNRSNAYKYPTTVTLDNVILSTSRENNVRKSLYVYQSSSDYKVTVNGTVNGEYTINDDLNGAVVFPERIQFDDSLNDTFNDTLANTVSKSAIVELKEGSSFSLESGVCHEGSKSKNVTFIGELDADNKPVSTINVAEKAVAAENAKHLSYQRGSIFTFENLVIENGTDTYDGIVCDELIYKNCVIKGLTTLYGKATFINCTFENTMENQYSIWTWGGTDVKFEGCTFNTNGKAILMFGEEKKTTLNVSNCIFNDREKGAAGKAAIEVGDANYGKHNIFTLNINDCEVNDFANGKNTDSKLWANKNNMDAAHLSVIIDGIKVL